MNKFDIELSEDAEKNNLLVGVAEDLNSLVESGKIITLVELEDVLNDYGLTVDSDEYSEEYNCAWISPYYEAGCMGLFGIIPPFDIDNSELKKMLYAVSGTYLVTANFKDTPEEFLDNKPIESVYIYYEPIDEEYTGVSPEDIQLY